ncbi:MAG: zinc-dependent peptidase [Phycisphaerales bacterium]|nr:zinc-dependent peptidase [Phycisphaerales bacterium]
MPTPWLDIIARDVPLVEALRGEPRARVLDTMRVLIDEKYWEGGGGFEVSDRVRVVIAAQVAFQLQGLSLDLLAGARSFIIYEGAYVQSQKRIGPGGVVHTGSQNLGEAWVNGPVVFSWADALDAAMHPGTGLNVVFHEIAHVLDAATGMLDGTPGLPTVEARGHWASIMARTFEQVAEHHRTGRGDVIRPYALTNVAEFFAVTSELFFDAPQILRNAHPQVHACFEAWVAGPSE